MDIKTLLKTYETPPHIKDVVRKSDILLLVGVSGAGKDTIKQKLVSSVGFGDIVSHTTRSLRSNNGKQEVDGVDYHFSDITKVANMLTRQEFIEAKLVHGDTVYGSSLRALNNALEKGVAVSDVDVQGVDEYKRISPSVKAVFILPPSYKEWRRRLEKRYTSKEEFEKDWPKRRDTAVREINTALSMPYYFFIVNNKLPEALKLIKNYANKKAYVHDDSKARDVAYQLLKDLGY